MREKAIVTGGAGFIGSHVVDALLARDFEVHVVDNFAGGRRDDRLNPAATLHEMDVRDGEMLAGVVAGAQYVFHLAALPRVQDSIDHPLLTHEVNVTGTLSALEAARKAGVRKFVLASSAAVYGDQDVMPLAEAMPATPKSPYGLHKYMGEEYCKLWSLMYGLPTVALRFFNVYGSRFDPNGAYALVVGKFMEQRRRGEALTVAGDGTNTRDYIHVSDIVAALIAAALSETVGTGEVINVGSGTETSVAALAALVGGPVTHTEARFEPKRSCAAIDRARELLSWQPEVPLADGIARLKAEYAA